MKRQPLRDLANELDRSFYRKALPDQSSLQIDGVGCSDDSVEIPLWRPRRRKRKSALDEYRPLVEAFVIRRARAARPERFTYLRLQSLIKKKSKRLFSISTIARRLQRWGLANGMRRYEK